MALPKLKPMLAELGTKKDLKKSGWIYEPKLDGTRTLCYKSGKRVRFLNRRGVWFEERYPELLNIWKNIKIKSGVLDGEIVVLDKNGKPDFSLLAMREHQTRKLRIEILSKQFPATLYIFDVLQVDKNNLTSKPLIKRKAVLENIIKESSRIKKIFWTTKGFQLWKSIKKLSLEGVMAKRARSTYQPGHRSSDWLKVKTLKTLDVVVGGWTEGTGARAETFGALLAGIYYKGKLRYIGRVGTGWSTQELLEYKKILKKLATRKCPFDVFAEEPSVLEKAHWIKPVLVAEVRFLYLTHDMRMRAPSFRRFRIDKKPSECVLSPRELIKLRVH